jgi:hypothetical protein
MGTDSKTPNNGTASTALRADMWGQRQFANIERALEIEDANRARILANLHRAQVEVQIEIDKRETLVVLPAVKAVQATGRHPSDKFVLAVAVLLVFYAFMGWLD